MNEADAGDIRFDDVNFLQRRDDKQLQIELGKELQAVLCRFIRTPAKGLVNDHEAEGARAHCAPLESKLIGETGGKDGVGQFFLLPSRFAAGVGVMFVFAVILAPALAGPEQEPVAHVGHLVGPPAVQLGLTITATETIDDLLYL